MFELCLITELQNVIFKLSKGKPLDREPYMVPPNRERQSYIN